MNQTLDAVSVPVSSPMTRARVGDFMALTKPGITFMVAITAGVGFYVAAPTTFDWRLFLHLIAGTLLSSAGAAALNMLLEREADAKMDRTKSRPLPAGRMNATEAAVFGTLLAAGGVAYLALLVNLLAAAISLAGRRAGRTWVIPARSAR